ncbi:ABC transporter substrate-binding protein [Microbacterium sp. SORGH_AS_0344]|uniref:peptide ABC transporter substrate-binding protein n=1 Tax=Microbacterium sp. SORGH_AS_0344 TaxID=3041767 RepID=UPI0027819D70|nr:ABC transporter substrate-binding protein [Microbacterium sp. SORGH_AS_0344]MDQ1085319.1 ABC-type transport system substrate-binding protein [Microbacterium sp. SORGH_AS_0344]
MKRRIALAVLVAGALALAGCSGGGGDETGPADVSIRVAVTDPQQLIPGRQSIAYDFNMAVWSPLAFLQSDGTLQNVQAESIESDDAQTWTITLRDGWTFHDGTPVTAQSYVDSWNAVAYGPNAFENSGQLASIVGYTDLNPAEGTPTTTAMSGLTVVDDLTFTVELVSPDGQFPLQVTQAQTAFFPMPESALSDFDAYNAHPRGQRTVSDDGRLRRERADHGFRV